MPHVMTREEVGKIVEAGGQGYTAEGVIAALKRRGIDVEGDPLPNPPPEMKLQRPDTSQVAQPAAAAAAPGVPTPQASAPPQAIPDVPDAPAPAPTNWGKTATNAIPSVAGMVGDAVLGPPGAALAGSAGEGLRQIVAGAGQLTGHDLGEVRGTGDELKAMGTEGLKQGAYALGGRGAGKALGFVAKGPMMAALRKVRIGDTNLAKVALDEGIGVGQRGLAKLNGKIDQWVAQRAAHLDAAGEAGLRYDPEGLAKEAARRVMAEVKGAPKIKSDEIKAINQWVRKFAKDNPNPIKPSKLLDLRQIADEIATPIRKNIEAASRGRGAPVEALTKIEGRLNSELADVARTHLNNIGQKVVKTAKGGMLTPVEHATNQLEKLTRLKQAVAPLVEKGMPLGAKIAPSGIGGSVGAVVGGYRTHTPQGALAGAIAGGTAAHPAFLSHLALLMHSPTLANAILPNLLRAGGFASEQ